MLLLATVAVQQKVQAQNIDIQVLYQFAGTPDGGQVYGPLAGDSAGNLYGTTSQGGLYGKGSVWKLDASARRPCCTASTAQTRPSGTPGWCEMRRTICTA